jgi:4'-phosphopantetheinyl transferase
MHLLVGSDDRNRAVTLIWSAKESALKALRTGLRSDTRRIRIEAFGQAKTGDWSSFHAVDAKSGDPFRGFWRSRGEMLMTIACGRAQCEPWEL